jgi:hypothetical protein
VVSPLPHYAINLAVIANFFDNIVGPVIVETDTLPIVALLAKEALDVGIGRIQHLIDVL